jgi:hypothetical protein
MSGYQGVRIPDVSNHDTLVHLILIEFKKHFKLVDHLGIRTGTSCVLSSRRPGRPTRSPGPSRRPPGPLPVQAARAGPGRRRAAVTAPALSVSRSDSDDGRRRPVVVRVRSACSSRRGACPQQSRRVTGVTVTVRWSPWQLEGRHGVGPGPRRSDRDRRHRAGPPLPWQPLAGHRPAGRRQARPRAAPFFKFQVATVTLRLPVA